MNRIDLLNYIRGRCEDDFEFFVKYFFKSLKGSKFIFSEHHHIMCRKLMSVYNGDIVHLIINMPPRYSKTLVVVQMFSAWCYMKNPRCEFIHLSYSDGLAMENSDSVKQILKSHEFQQLWPTIKITTNKDSKKAWSTTDGGCFYATSAGGQVTGYGAGKVNCLEFSGAIIVDDPLKPDDAHSDTKRKAVNRRWDETIKSRFNSTKTPCIVIMQRIHEDDFCGMLLEDNEYNFDQLILPAILDEGKETERALWEGKHTLEQLYMMRMKNSYMFASQMQQRPSPLGGGLIKGEWFGRYDVLPQLKYRAMYIDTAQKAKTYNDYQVAEVWGLGINGNLYLLDILRDKFEAYQLEVIIPDFWNKHKAITGTPLRYMMIEDKSSGTELIQKIQKKIQPKIPVKPIPRGADTNKVTRVMNIQGYIESGYVYLPRNASFVSDFIAECESFTADDSHKHDDQVDAMCDAISDMLHNKSLRFADWV